MLTVKMGIHDAEPHASFLLTQRRESYISTGFNICIFFFNFALLHICHFPVSKNEDSHSSSPHLINTSLTHGQCSVDTHRTGGQATWERKVTLSALVILLFVSLRHMHAPERIPQAG